MMPKPGDRTRAPGPPRRSAVTKRNAAGLSEAESGPDLKRVESEEDHRKLRARFARDFAPMLAYRLKPIETIRRRQFQRIQALVDHAYATVPLYRQKYTAVGFRPGDLRSWSDFRLLPTLSKTEVIDAWPGAAVSSRHDTEFMTMSSGSSGRFVYVAVSEDAVHFENLQMARQNLVQSANRVDGRDATLFIMTCPWWFSSTGGLYPQVFMSTRTAPEAAAAAIRRDRPGVVSLYPSYLRQLAAHCGRLADHGVKLVITHSEHSSAAERAAFAEDFGCPVLDEYSSEELIRIAYQCPHRAYHVEEDACYVEILDVESQTPVTPGCVGEVVGTNLVNEATPLIRYRQGDLSSEIVGADRCECGSSFGRIAPPRGRIQDSFRLHSGRTVAAGALMDDAYNWVLESRIPARGLQYQIVQTALDRVEVHLIPGKDQELTVSDSARGVIAGRLRALLGPEIAIDVMSAREPLYRAGAKIKPVISRLCHD